MEMIGHGGKPLVEQVITDKDQARKVIKDLKTMPVSRQMATEAIGIAYGFFSPIEGFMKKADVEATCKKMELADGTVWSIPIVYDISDQEIADYKIQQGDKILLTYDGNPLAIFDIEEIYTYDKEGMAQDVYGTKEEKHPGVKRTYAYKDKFLGGKITLVNEPKIREPFTSYFLTPRQHRELFTKKGWQRIVAHQTRNVPHSGHEWLMKHAYIAAHGDLPVEQQETLEGRAISGVLVNCIVGEKRTGDYIDEAIVLCQDELRKSGYFRNDIHMVTMTFWDMRYAGPREAVHHAIIRTNLGLTHHMFGRDHAGVGTYYHSYQAHHLLMSIPKEKLNITPIYVLEWAYCPHCGEVTCVGLCGHHKELQKFSGTKIRSIIMDEVKPTRLIFRPEVFDVVMECSKKYGFGSPFVTTQYLEQAKPAFSIEPL
ncbi:MAG: sulfate adenylyltransferase [Desulfobacca sp. 4484_104]|nr:MAG: sulfate adenylyltransferase [Desulfobacca sp. 4484_104]RLA89922.1 MAG: sulfate adenylyltransferase [Deltaproteobacteria bacterium]